MSGPVLTSQLRRLREAQKLSQSALARRVQVSRQALHAIESGRQVPSTTLALQLGRALNCSVEEIFHLTSTPDDARFARIVPRNDASTTSNPTRVTLGRVGETWIAHPLGPESLDVADGFVMAPSSDPSLGAIDLIDNADDPTQNLLVAGCAPLIQVWASTTQQPSLPLRMRWLPENNRRSRELFERGEVHIAGIHRSQDRTSQSELLDEATFSSEYTYPLIHFTRWRQGIVLAPQNPHQIRSTKDILKPGLRVVQREAGSEAQLLLQRELKSGYKHLSRLAPTMQARTHQSIAQLVATGAADAGIAIESVALHYGLDFIPLTEESFDLLVRPDVLEDSRFTAAFDILISSRFRRQADGFGGYDCSSSGSKISSPRSVNRAEERT